MGKEIVDYRIDRQAQVEPSYPQIDEFVLGNIHSFGSSNHTGEKGMREFSHKTIML